ncbi:MAG: formylglycine-generating enzyme family protein [Bacteriovoracaceae bacterium]
MKFLKYIGIISFLLISNPSFSEGSIDSIFSFVQIPKGKFWMGSPRKESGRYKDEKRHRVYITKPFFMAKTEITQLQWVKVMGFNPSYFQEQNDCPENHQIIDGVHLCPNRPVENIKWIKIQDFLDELNKLSTRNYRLPTEAEWEYAARAGSDMKFIHSDSHYSLEDYAWFDDNTGEGPMDVATKRPNQFGLYDMSGNVWEWVQDWYANRYFNRSPRRDPKGPRKGETKVLRGGSWYSLGIILRVAHRGYSKVNDSPSYQNGFRIVYDIEP